MQEIDRKLAFQQGTNGRSMKMIFLKEELGPPQI
jgi:hypothetical protein